MNESKADDFVKIENDFTHGPQDRPPLVNSSGVALATQLAILERNDGAQLVSLAFYLKGDRTKEGMGLYHPMTPEGARFLADKLLNAAQAAEDAATPGARALLAAALAKGKPDA